MDTRSRKSVLIDLFNLPPLPNKKNNEESYMDMLYNYYVPDGRIPGYWTEQTGWNLTERP